MGRSSRALPVAGFVLALVGLALLVLEVVRTINGSALGSLGFILLWVGVGLIGAAIILLTIGLLAPATEPMGAGLPADPDGPDESPAPPMSPGSPAADGGPAVQT